MQFKQRDERRLCRLLDSERSLYGLFGEFFCVARFEVNRQMQRGTSRSAATLTCALTPHVRGVGSGRGRSVGSGIIRIVVFVKLSTTLRALNRSWRVAHISERRAQCPTLRS